MALEPEPSSSSRRGVLCAGTIVVDVGKVIDHYPDRDGLALIESVSLSTGGPALNLAVDLARLGAPFPLAVAGLVGADQHGDFVVAALTDNGVDVSAIRRSTTEVTSFTDAMVVRDGGSRTFFHHPGANGAFAVEDVDLAATSARILHMGAPGLHPGMDTSGGWAQVLAAARAAGLRTNLELVSLSPEQIRGVARPCLPHLDSIVINDVEASAVAGVDLTVTDADGEPDWAGTELVARRLIELGVGTLAAVHFPAGCVAASPGGQVWRQGSVRLPRNEIRSATGAGDAFAAGVIYGLHEGWPVEDCLRAAVCSAAACLRSPATSDGVLELAACLALGEVHGFRSS